MKRFNLDSNLDYLYSSYHAIDKMIYNLENQDEENENEEFVYNWLESVGVYPRSISYHERIYRVRIVAQVWADNLNAIIGGREGKYRVLMRHIRYILNGSWSDYRTFLNRAYDALDDISYRLSQLDGGIENNLYASKKKHSKSRLGF